MNINRFFIITFSVIFLSCGTEPVKVEIIEVKPGNLSKLESFFERSEHDSVKAGKVLEKQNIIQHLTHLRKMDSGGKKYYLLEKDDITKVINSVTEGIYIDYILINKNGDIIYTNRNDELFGTSINNLNEKSTLKKCFLNRTGVYFEDVSYLAPSSKIYSLYVSSPVYVEGNFHGVLILQVEIKKIIEILEAGTEIFSRDGVIRVTSNEEKIFTKYSGFDKIDINILDSNGEFLVKEHEIKIKFSKFSFKEINWIIMQKEL